MSSDPRPPAPDELTTSSSTDPTGDPPGEHAGPPGEPPGDLDDGPSTSRRLMDALLSTTPQQSMFEVKENLSVDDAGAHAVIGSKKFLSEFTSGDMRGGTTAIEHFAAAAISRVMAAQQDDTDTSESDSSSTKAPGPDVPTAEAIGEPEER